ncbi:hypothetical protein CSQ96_14040 [Janthinobacterium sp. BJB412]|nr:hypothetical protein CSQ96_14040 [Janthinobacterium sp. BJB412]
MWQRMMLLGTLCCLAGSAPAAPRSPAPAAAGPAAEAGGPPRGMALFERYAPSMPDISLRFHLLGFPADALRKPLRLSLASAPAAPPPAFAYLDDGAAPPASAGAAPRAP